VGAHDLSCSQGRIQAEDAMATGGGLGSCSRSCKR
jgi:hypothetical protein